MHLGARLQASQSVTPRAAHLVALAHSAVEPLAALRGLAAFHQGRSHAPLRRDFEGVCAGAHVFPVGKDVEPLLFLMFRRLVGMMQASTTHQDDILVAAWAAGMILQIHPFQNGNGRSAVDFAQLYLMRRWGLPTPPLDLDGRHDQLGAVVAHERPLVSGLSAREIEDHARGLAKEIESTHLDDLRQGARHRQLAAALLGPTVTQPRKSV